ncbi:MAG: M28 family metallopeptidase [Alphaproteobacteria bacterium]|nr:M28 family metallopeptidase [Alphaproteobacteria bacterium]
MFARAALGLVLLALAACSPKATEIPPAATEQTAEAPPAGALLATSPEIAAADISARVKELADDKYKGRGPGTVAGEASAQWIADEMKRIGLEPAVDGSYFQTIEMVAQTVDRQASILSFAVGGKTMDLKLGNDSVYLTKRQDQTTVNFADSDVIFVGYGVVAPEADWNDYAGLDVKGKTVVMFVNDPGFVTNDESLFNGRAMTYYGRWTYKYEEAGRQGATAAILIHETEPAAYGWDVVESSWSGEQADLVRADAGASRALLEGWVSLDRGMELFAAAGLDMAALQAAANKPGFKPVPMTGLKASATIVQTVNRRQSRNVAGTIRGATAADEHVLYMAHWDHLGEDRTAMPGADAIYNGAVDNATGVAEILEIAEAMAAGPRPARSVTFLAVTLEESGLLGSAYFGDYPFIPLNRIVGGINIDAINPIGRTKDVIVVGAGASQLEDSLKSILADAGRVVRPDPEPEAGYFYRSDHISLSKKGVPMLYIDGGIDALDGGEAKGKTVSEDYRQIAYHAPSDEFRDDWDFSGMEEDAKVNFELARRLANSSDWPEWYEGNEFRAIRETSLKGE